MLALFIILAALIVVHGLAVGAYLTVYKLKIATTAGRAAGTITIGAAYAVVVIIITVVLLMPPIA